jgi:serine/threonine protein kinase
MKVYVRGKNTVNLTQSDFIAKGGEGEVYGKGGLVYKIYHETNKMIPEAKIKELLALDNDSILRPRDILMDDKNNLIGFTMKYVKNTDPMCKLFTNDFRSRNGIVQDQTLELVENIKKTIQFIHNRKCLIVDGNEFNYLVDNKNFVTPYFIDVDSYQTPHFQATAIMPSIRDYNTKGFSELTDWFSFAIIACQLFVGIHPFKGKHKTIKGIEDRVVKNISVFNKDVNVPSTTRDFSFIPKHYFDWFLKLFEKGERIAPPDVSGVILVVPTVVKAAYSTAQFEIALVHTSKEEIKYFQVIHGNKIIKTDSEIQIGRTKYPGIKTEVLFTQKRSVPISVFIKDEMLEFKALNKGYSWSGQEIAATDFMIIDNTLYAKNGGSLLEFEFEDSNDIIKPMVKSVWSIMPQSSEVYSNIVYQSVLGKPYIVVPLPKHNGPSSCVIKFIKELEGYKIVAAKYQSNVAMFVGSKKGQYDRIILKFSDNHEDYSCRIMEDISNNSINFTVLDNGVCIFIFDDKNLEIFLTRYDKPAIKSIASEDITLEMKLYKDGNQLMFAKGNQLYSMKMK